MPTVTTNAALGTYGANLALTYLLRRRGLHCWLGLHTDDPDGATPHELAGDGYIRDNISFHPPSSRGIVSSNGQVFAGVPVGSVNYLGVWEQVSSGGLIMRMHLDTPLSTIDGGKVVLAAGDVGFLF